MNTFSHARFVTRGLPRHRLRLKSENVMTPTNWAIMSRIGWIATAGLIAFLLWQTAAAVPLWSPAVSGLLLVVIGILVGLRIGADSLAAYNTDVHRLNKRLADQNRELQDANAILLKQVSSEVPASWITN